MYILRVFHQMLSDAAYRRQPGASEVLGFAAQTVRNVFAKLVPAEENETNKADTLAGDILKLHSSFANLGVCLQAVNTPRCTCFC